MAHTILIIDGEVSQREMLTQSLQTRLGYRTLACSSIREAMHYFGPDSSTASPDVILFDWSSSSGGETIVSLNGIKAQTPLVALVKYGDYDAAVAALNAGAQDFLTKPVAMERISTTFRNLLLFRDVRRETERLRRQLAHELQTSQPQDSDMPLPPFAFLGEDGNIRRMNEIEAEAIRFAIHYYHGRMTEVAKRLGIGRSTLYRKLNGLGVRQQEAA